MIILRHFHFKMLPEIHFNVLHADFFSRILFCPHNQITAMSSQHPITGQRNASCLISIIIGTYWVQARTVRIQIRLQGCCFFSKLESIIRSTTITNRRQTHGTARKSHTTITKHQEDKLSKATSSLFRFRSC